MGGGDKAKTTREASQQEALHLEVFTDYERITPAQTDVMVLATVTAAPLANEERRAPITICAAIDRRWVYTKLYFIWVVCIVCVLIVGA